MKPSSATPSRITINTIERWEMENIGVRDDNFRMMPDPDGEFVKYEDAVRLVEALRSETVALDGVDYKKLHAEETDDFNAGFDAFKAGVAFNDLPDTAHDQNGVGWAWAWFLESRSSRSARAWNDDAMKLLRDINEARDARLPQELWNRVTAITGGSK